jgi:hypothetical protein
MLPILRKLFFFFFVSVFAANALKAQDVIIPSAPSNGNSLKDFLPPYWDVMKSVSGDLDGDSVNDIAAILEYRYTLRGNDENGAPITCKPRILVVLTAIKGDFHYHLWVQNNHIILPESDLSPEPLQVFSISHDTLYLSFSGGIQRTWNIAYQFASDDDRMKLMTVDFSVEIANTTSQKCWHLDFAHRRATPCSAAEQPRKLKARIYLDEMGHPFSYPLFPDIMI